MINSHRISNLAELDQSYAEEWMGIGGTRPALSTEQVRDILSKWNIFL